MAEEFAIRIPQEFVNDDVVKLVRWMVVDGQEVQKDQTLAEIETSKALVELAAVAAGKISQRAKPGEDVKVGQVVGYISTNGNAAAAFAESGPARNSAAVPGYAKSEIPTDTRFSKKALELLERHALSPALFSGRGLVREQDVLAQVERAQKEKRTAPNGHFALGDISLERVSLPLLFAEFERGTLDSDFLSRLRKDSESFAVLPSAEKIEAYRQHGAFVGEGVVFGAGAMVTAPQIVLGDRVQLGANSSVRCRERFLAGELTSFRSGLSVRGGTVVLGENVYGGGNVQIGGGGNGDPSSVLSVGDGCYIGDDAFINICRPVLIGREVFLTQRSIVVTHNIGHSILEGYENRFSPVVLEDYAQVGMNSTIYAGVRIGRGSILMSNSYAVSSIPQGRLAAGVPARVMREAARTLDRKRQIEIAHEMMREYHELLERKGHAVKPFQREPFPMFEMQYQDQRFQIRFLENYFGDSVPDSMDQSIIWTFKNSGNESKRALTVIDLLEKSLSGGGGIFVESTREFLRKRGIRLGTAPWRYSGGLI